jgi:hypothetical protein
MDRRDYMLRSAIVGAIPLLEPSLSFAQGRISHEATDFVKAHD